MLTLRTAKTARGRSDQVNGLEGVMIIGSGLIETPFLYIYSYNCLRSNKYSNVDIQVTFLNRA